MKAPFTISSKLRHGLVVAVAAALCAAALSACGGSAPSGQGELTQARREVAFHIHHEERLRRLEARLDQVKKQSKQSGVPSTPEYVPSAPAPDYGTYPEPTTGGSCGGELSVNAYTSCPFAENVENAYYAEIGSGPGQVTVYSPVTERDYLMSCTGSPHECTGGDDAVVYFP